ncbi:MAG: hypothetical protein U0572_11400 [Phycisphaerales bacterium]
MAYEGEPILGFLPEIRESLGQWRQEIEPSASVRDLHNPFVLVRDATYPNDLLEIGRLWVEAPIFPPDVREACFTSSAIALGSDHDLDAVNGLAKCQCQQIPMER